MKQHSINNERLSAGGIVLATLLTYASTFTFGWVYDDPPQIPQNQNLEWSRLGYLFTHHLWAANAEPEARFYRPLLTVWFLVNKTLFGLNPHWFHVTTVLAHVAATALAYAVGRRLLKNSGAALLAAAIFGLHPLQAETASWISSVNDSLAAVFCLGSFLMYRNACGGDGLCSESAASVAQGDAKNTAPVAVPGVLRQPNATSSVAPPSAYGEKDFSAWGGAGWILSGLLFLLGLLVKEVSIVLPAIILIDVLANSRNARSRDSGRGVFTTVVAVYGLIVVVWLAFRAWILGQAAAASSLVPWKTVVLSAPKVVLFDLYRIFLPRGLSPQYDLRLIETPDTQFLGWAAILGLVIFVAIFAARRSPQLWTPFAWIIFPILPTLNLGWLNQHDFIHDRYTYFSLFGVALVAGCAYSAVRQKWPQTKLLKPAAAIIVVVLGFASAIQSQYWVNDVSLFARAVEIAPQNEWAQLNYGAALSSRGRNAEAAPHFVRSYELSPGWRAADFAGYAYQHSGDLNDSERWYRTAIEQNPTLATAWFGLGQIHLEQHKPEATAALRRAIELQPEADGYHYELGAALEEAGHPDQARSEYQIELQLHPYQVGARKAIDRLDRH